MKIKMMRTMANGRQKGAVLIFCLVFLLVLTMMGVSSMESAVLEERMAGNMDRLGGLVHSQRILLALTQAGSSREDAYRLVQRNAMKVWNSYQTSGDSEVDFLTELLNDEDVRKYLSETEIRDRFDLGYHTKHVDTIFRRVFG